MNPTAQFTSRICARALWPLLCCALSTSLAQSAEPPAASAAIPTGPGSLTAIWYNANYKGSGGGGPERDRVLKPTDGTMPPMLPWVEKLLNQRIADSAAGSPYANTLSECLPGGIPQADFGAPYPVQIIESPTQVTILFEEQNHFRQIALNRAHRKDPDPSYFGDSVGHWEGDTLVVDTVGLTTRTTLDQIGLAHSDALHVIERYRRSGPDSLQIRLTIDDPKAFSKTWETEASYKLARPGTEVSEYICENNHNEPADADHQGFQPLHAH